MSRRNVKKIKRQLKHNIVRIYGNVWGKCSPALQSESTSNIRYKDMAEILNIVWIMNKLKLICAGFDYHINKIYSTFHTLKSFYMMRQQSGETVTKYFDRFKPERVNVEIPKRNLTKHE